MAKEMGRKMRRIIRGTKGGGKDGGTTMKIWRIKEFDVSVWGSGRDKERG